MYVRVDEIFQFQYGLTLSKSHKCWRSENKTKQNKDKESTHFKPPLGIEMSFLLCLAAKTLGGPLVLEGGGLDKKKKRHPRTRDS